MTKKLISFIADKISRKHQAPSTVLPQGLEAAPPIENEKLRNLLEVPDITTSGGVHLVADGQPLLRRQEVHH